MTAPRLLLAALGTLAWAAPAPAGELRGQVVGVDLKKQEVRVEGRGRDKGRTLTLGATAATEVLFGRQPGALADLATGRRVRVTYQERDGRRVATAIRVTGAKPAARADGSVSGVLRRVAWTDREVVVIGPGARGPETETSVAVPEGVKVTRGGRSIGYGDLKEGEQATVLLERRGDRPTARAIQAGSAAPSAGSTVRRVRLALRLLDFVLKQADQARRP